MTRLMKSVARDISSNFASRLRLDKNDENSVLKAFSKMIAREMVKQLLKEARRDPEGVKAIFANTKNSGKVSKGLKKAEGKLTKIIEKGFTNSVDDDDDDEDKAKGTGAKFPNLKYAQSKYKNVESILKYVESKDDKAGGVKLVIMNFND